MQMYASVEICQWIAPTFLPLPVVLESVICPESPLSLKTKRKGGHEAASLVLMAAQILISLVHAVNLSYLVLSESTIASSSATTMVTKN